MVKEQAQRSRPPPQGVRCDAILLQRRPRRCAARRQRTTRGAARPAAGLGPRPEDGGDTSLSTFTRGEGYRYEGPYWAPYRCLYSRNIGNLFMAGRDISVSHDGLGAVRVMRTCGMMGEVVAMAASICKTHACSPRGVYQHHLDELKQLLQRGVGAEADPSNA